MTVVLLPVRHPGQRHPPAFAVRLPNITNNPTPIVVAGMDAETQAAVQVEIAGFEAALAEAEACIDRLCERLRPFMAEDVQ